MYKPGYRPDIDVLRGISVALVVIYHAFPDFLPGGFIGVDVFFVISGFLITTIVVQSMNANTFSVMEFYRRRIRRIFPSLVTVLLAALLLGWLFLYPEEYAQLGRHVLAAAAFLLNFELIGEIGYFDVESHYKPLLHFWSLSIEEQYYLIWPLLLMVFHRVSPRPLLFFLLLFGVSLLLNLYFVFDYPAETYFHTATRFWQLAAGSVLAVLAIRQPFTERRSLFFIGVAVIVASAFVIQAEHSYPGAWGLLPVIGAALVVMSATSFRKYFGMRTLGLFSYPLYLWHWLLISLAYIYLGRQPSALALVAIIMASMLLAWLTWRYVERLRYVSGSGKFLVLSLVATAAVGYMVDREKGLPDRNSIAYYSESAVQFTRTPHLDEACDEYASKRLEGERLFHYCRGSGLDKERLVAVIGDSHAHVWYPGMAAVAAEYGYGTILMANSSCPVLPGFQWGRNPAEIEKCRQSIGQVISLLENDERIEIVAIATRGPVYMHDEVQGEFTEASVRASFEQSTRSELVDFPSYFSGFERMVDTLSATDHVESIFYLLENPELDFLPKEVIPRPYDVFNLSTNRNFMDRDLYELRMKHYREGMLAVSDPKLTFLDPVEVFCDETVCQSFIDGNFAYVDDDHFSVFGSHLVTRHFENVIFGEEEPDDRQE